jgi:hypothetical protein
MKLLLRYLRRSTKVGKVERARELRPPKYDMRILASELVRRSTGAAQVEHVDSSQVDSPPEHLDIPVANDIRATQFMSVLTLEVQSPLRVFTINTESLEDDDESKDVTTCALQLSGH